MQTINAAAHTATARMLSFMPRYPFGLVASWRGSYAAPELHTNQASVLSANKAVRCNQHFLNVAVFFEIVPSS
jgi:hypothetical protein